ncbi:MAG: nucleoside deaminase [Clostridia bacterium]
MSTEKYEHERLMRAALAQAELALAGGEIPVGAVMAVDGELIAAAHNLREQTGDPTAHAEMLVIREAARVLGTRRLNRCTLYVTLEPCPMCAGALSIACVGGCYFGARDERQGCVESVYALTRDPAFYHRLPCVGGLLAAEAAALMTRFFEEKRTKGAPKL